MHNQQLMHKRGSFFLSFFLLTLCFLLHVQLSFGLLYPHFDSLRQRKAAYQEHHDVWMPGRMPHPNVLVFPGVQGGMTNCNRLKPITEAYDFFVVTKRMHNRAQIGEEADATGWLLTLWACSWLCLRLALL